MFYLDFNKSCVFFIFYFYLSRYIILHINCNMGAGILYIILNMYVKEISIRIMIFSSLFKAE